MSSVTLPRDAGAQYRDAYAAHYSQRNLRLALQLYQNLLKSYPDALEADYSRLQVQNIVSAVVPKRELFDAQFELALAYFAQNEDEQLPLTSPSSLGPT
jgi:hypothetical protein